MECSIFSLIIHIDISGVIEKIASVFRRVTVVVLSVVCVTAAGT